MHYINVEQMLSKNNREVMATINLKVRGKRNPSPLYIRFSVEREKDIWYRSKILLNPKAFDNRREQLKHTLSNSIKNDLRAKIDGLKTHIYNEYNVDYMNGEHIDKEWLDIKLCEYFGRPKEERNSSRTPDRLIYFIDFSKWWMNTKSTTWITSKGKKLADSAIRQYNSFIEIFESFEDGDGRVKIKNISSEVVYNFIHFMQQEENYASTTTKRHLNRLRFFIKRAKKEGVEINETYDDPVFINKDDQLLKPYLNFDEINSIYNLDLSGNDYLDNVRDTFIIGLWTGLRVSDLQEKLDISNFEEEYIKIKTQKTSKWVVIPLHYQVKEILKKRLGNLPRKIHKNDFNIEIKEICKLCNINQVIEGSRYDGKKNRNVIGQYSKYKLITSHTCRRSFATNLYGLVPNHVIMAVGGWSSEVMMLHYIKKTNKEHADVLKETWDDIFNQNKEKWEKQTTK